MISFYRQSDDGWLLSAWVVDGTLVFDPLALGFQFADWPVDYFLWRFQDGSNGYVYTRTERDPE